MRQPASPAHVNRANRSIPCRGVDESGNEMEALYYWKRTPTHLGPRANAATRLQIGSIVFPLSRCNN